MVPPILSSSEEQKSHYTQMHYERNYSSLGEDLHPYILLSEDGNFHILPRNVHKAVRLVILYFSNPNHS